MSYFMSQNLTKIEAVTGYTFACICHTAFSMFSCLQINFQPLYLHQFLKFHSFDWLIEGHGAYQKMVSLQPMPSFSPLSVKSITFAVVR